ncbi:thiamine pyrophosphate-dependent enzyme, partial [Gammaproteobacteria bacterium AB-CW1]|nr:thiamine pyrophosphate-dependent enzyme [Gammaproteobacteria bacterium AB-CW1]
MNEISRAHKPKMSREHAFALLHQMLRIRRFEERCVELYTQEKIRGFLHVCIGEEAVGTGVMHNLRADEAVISTYREHGHALLNRISME